MRRLIAGYYKFVQDLLLENPGAYAFYEQKVPLFYAPQDTGTVDVRIIHEKSRRIWIIDLKYGAGVSVYAKENKQLGIYAESSIREMEGRMSTFFDSWLVDMVIYQPRDRNNEQVVRQWAIRRSELTSFMHENIEKPVLKMQVGDVNFVAEPNTVCRFCPAKGICEAYKNYGLQVLPPESREVTPAFPKIPEPKMMTRDQRIRVIKGRKALEDWLEAVEDYEVHQLLNGDAPAGMKLVEGKSNRAWTDEKKVAYMLSEYLDAGLILSKPEPEMISVAAAESLIGKKEFSQLSRFITKPKGKPTLVFCA
jgi:hypothetical protein